MDVLTAAHLRRRAGRVRPALGARRRRRRNVALPDAVFDHARATHTGSYKLPANGAKRRSDDSISIRHVYDYVADLGAAAPGSVRELHIFSHAWAGGPVLVNTWEDFDYDTGGPKEHLRDPQDKDPRTKDFDPANMPRLADFRAAFASDAHAKVWGCQATKYYRRVVRAIGKTKNDGEIIRFKDDDGKVRVATAGSAKIFFVNTIIPETYMAKLKAAVGGGLTMHGAPPGVDARYRRAKAGDRVREYMYVKEDDFTLEFTVFRKRLGLTFDEVSYASY